MLNHDGKVFGVPWVWGLTALAINEKSFETPPTSISVMWDEAHKGRVVMRDDAVEAVQFGAIATGQNINDIKDMDAVKAKLTSLMPQIRTFWSSENDWNQMVASNQIDVGTYWSGSADRAKTQFKLPVSLVIPQEGAVAWLDAFSIPAGSKNVAGAEAFINYMIDPAFYVEWVTKVGAPVSANEKAVAALPEDSFNRKVMGDPEGGRAHPVPGADHRRAAREVSGALAGAEGEREVAPPRTVGELGWRPTLGGGGHGSTVAAGEEGDSAGAPSARARLSLADGGDLPAAVGHGLLLLHDRPAAVRKRLVVHAAELRRLLLERALPDAALVRRCGSGWR